MPLTIELTVIDIAKNVALANGAVYVWHCDRDGNYSLYSDGVTDENYLRGVQATDGYARSVTNLSQVSLATDMVFRDGWDNELGTVIGTVAGGLTVAPTVGV